MPLNRSLIVGSVVMGGLLLGLWRCHPKESNTAAGAPAATGSGYSLLGATKLAASPATASSTGITALAGSAQAPAASVHEPSAMPAASGAPAASAFGSTDNTVNQVLTSVTATDLTLYSHVERATQHDVPRAVRDLVDAKKNGATRAQLSTQINATITDRRVRDLLAHWLDDSLGTSGGAAPPAPGVVSGSGPAHVKPFKAK